MTFGMKNCIGKGRRTLDDPHDIRNLPKANPMLHEPTEYSDILLEEIISEHSIAFGSDDPEKIREWLIKRCGLWQEGANDKYMDDSWTRGFIPESSVTRHEHTDSVPYFLY